MALRSQQDSQPIEKMHIAVIANGEFSHSDRLTAHLEAMDQVIAADGGANWLYALDRTPDLIVGDLDSISPLALRAFQSQGCPLQRYPADKDETDTELALCAAKQRGASDILLLGALGGRIDHELANIQLLTLPMLSETRLRIFDGTSYISLIRGGWAVHGEPGDLLSLLPWGGDAHGIETSGLQYPLRYESLYLGPARGVSNVLLGTEAQVHLKQGWLLAIHTPLSHLTSQEQGRARSQT
jgi:thiamine pyrophosphokinase